jgi:hypothetical protein
VHQVTVLANAEKEMQEVHLHLDKKSKESPSTQAHVEKVYTLHFP